MDSKLKKQGCIWKGNFSMEDSRGSMFESDISGQNNNSIQDKILSKNAKINILNDESNDEDYLEQIRNGAKEFEMFWLRPRVKDDMEAVLRLRINGKINGWKLKDELVRSVGLDVGDCISTEVSVQCGPNIIDDDGDTDLFAGGESADWLLSVVTQAPSVEGCIVDCRVRFSYKEAPVGGPEGRSVYKASLVLLEGIRYVGMDDSAPQLEDLAQSLFPKFSH